MSHLTDEQFEGLLQGQREGRDHLTSCGRCRDRLAEKEALSKRLRRAFTDVAPAPELGRQVRSELAQRRGSPAPPMRLSPVRARPRLPWKRGLSAAAAVLLLAVVIAISLTPSAAQATQSTVAGIHAINLSVKEHVFWQESDPRRLAARYGEILGVTPRLPPVTDEVRLCSCCVKKCTTKYVVGSYVAGTTEGVITVAVVREPAESLGTPQMEGGRLYYESSHGDCHLAALTLDGQTYCAAGRMDHHYLRALLAQLTDSGALDSRDAEPDRPSQIPMH